MYGEFDLAKAVLQVERLRVSGVTGDELTQAQHRKTVALVELEQSGYIGSELQELLQRVREGGLAG